MTAISKYLQTEQQSEKRLCLVCPQHGQELEGWQMGLFPFLIQRDRWWDRSCLLSRTRSAFQHQQNLHPWQEPEHSLALKSSHPRSSFGWELNLLRCNFSQGCSLISAAPSSPLFKVQHQFPGVKNHPGDVGSCKSGCDAA